MSTGVRTLRISDELDLATMPQLVRSVRRALDERPQTLHLDLSGCRFAGVDAVGELAALTEQAGAQGTTLVLVDVPASVHRVIDLLGLERRLRCLPAPRSQAASA